MGAIDEMISPAAAAPLPAPCPAAALVGARRGAGDPALRPALYLQSAVVGRGRRRGPGRGLRERLLRCAQRHQLGARRRPAGSAGLSDGRLSCGVVLVRETGNGHLTLMLRAYHNDVAGDDGLVRLGIELLLTALEA